MMRGNDMKKLSVVLAAIALVTMLSGCGSSGSPSAGQTPSGESPSAASPSPGQSSPDQASASPDEGTAREESSTLTFEIEGTQETVDVELRRGEFAQGALRFSVYVDTKRYGFAPDGDLYRIEPEVELPVVARLEIGFLDGSVSEAVDGVFGEYEDSGTEPFGAYSARCLRTKQDGLSVAAYLIEAGGGVVTLVTTVSPEAAEGHGARLYALAKTIVTE